MGSNIEIAAIIRELLMARKGEVITLELAAERANNIAQWVALEIHAAAPKPKPTMIDCYDCGGYGFANAQGDDERCPTCHGLHVVEEGRAIRDLSTAIMVITGHKPETFQRDPGGELCAPIGQGDGWYAPRGEAVRLIEKWAQITGETIVQQSDEPDYDAPSAAESREQEINTYLSLK